MRCHDWKSSDLDEARAAVAAWGDEHPHGNAAQLIADIDRHFHPDYAVVRGILFAVDRSRARQVIGPAGAGR